MSTKARNPAFVERYHPSIARRLGRQTNLVIGERYGACIAIPPPVCE